MDDGASWAKWTVRGSEEEMDEGRERGTLKALERERISGGEDEEMMECCWSFTGDT